MIVQEVGMAGTRDEKKNREKENIQDRRKFADLCLFYLPWLSRKHSSYQKLVEKIFLQTSYFKYFLVSVLFSYLVSVIPTSQQSLQDKNFVLQFIIYLQKLAAHYNTEATLKMLVYTCTHFFVTITIWLHSIYCLYICQPSQFDGYLFFDF